MVGVGMVGVGEGRLGVSEGWKGGKEEGVGEGGRGRKGSGKQQEKNGKERRERKKGRREEKKREETYYAQPTYAHAYTYMHNPTSHTRLPRRLDPVSPPRPFSTFGTVACCLSWPLAKSWGKERVRGEREEKRGMGREDCVVK